MNFRRLLPALLLGLAACAAPPLAEQPPLSVSPLRVGPNERIGINQVEIVTDASGTMYARETFPQAKALTQTFVAGAPDGSYRAGLVGFGGSERITHAMAPFDRPGLASTADSLRILGDLDGYGGTTPMHRVFDEIRTELDGQGGRTAVVVFSDGLPDCTKKALEYASALATSLDGNVCFHTVQTGDDPAGTEFLQELANVTTCGSHRTASSVQDPNAFMGFERDVFEIAGTGAPPPRPTMPLPDDPCADVVRLRGINFDFDKYNIKPEFEPVLDVAVDRMRQCPDLRMRIDGHTDWVGTEEYNQGLSERRAESVRRFMVGRGIDASRLTTKGFGELDPIAPNQTSEGRALNRRVELQPQQ